MDAPVPGAKVRGTPPRRSSETLRGEQRSPGGGSATDSAPQRPQSPWPPCPPPRPVPSRFTCTSLPPMRGAGEAGWRAFSFCPGLRSGPCGALPASPGRRSHRRPTRRGARLLGCRMRESGERSGHRVHFPTCFLRCWENSIKHPTGAFRLSGNLLGPGGILVGWGGEGRIASMSMRSSVHSGVSR